MTRTISLITATIGAALLFAVPAYADNWGADKAAPVDTRSEGLNRLYGLGEYAPVDVRSEGLNKLHGLGEYASPLDARERSMATRPAPTAGSDFYADGFAAAITQAQRSVVTSPVRDDRFTIDHSQVPVPASATGSGREIDWPQLGVGFAIGILLALGLYLAARFTRIRPVAH